MSAQLDVRPGYHPGSVLDGGLSGDHGLTCRAGACGAGQPEEHRPNRASPQVPPSGAGRSVAPMSAHVCRPTEKTRCE